jgi:hypothetical protein
VIAVYCVQYYDWSTFKVFMCEKNMFYCWGFSEMDTLFAYSYDVLTNSIQRALALN